MIATQRAGRKPKPGLREPSGRLKRPTLDQLRQMEAARERQEMETVLAQPHRLGRTDTECESSLGRFVLSHKLNRDFITAGEAYGGLKRRFRAAWGAPQDERHGIAGSGEGPSTATVEAWRRQISSIDAALASSYPGGEALRAVCCLAVDKYELPSGWEAAAVAGLARLAVEMGVTSAKRHPFRF